MTEDTKRLGLQREDVLAVMRGGDWKTFDDIQRTIQFRFGRYHPEASISARLRDLRRQRYGGWTVNRRPRRGPLNEYRVTPAEPLKAVQLELIDRIKEAETL